MSKTQKNVQLIFKIGQILSTIVYIACIVGLCGILIGAIALACGVAGIRIGGDALISIIEVNAGITINTIYTTMACGFILCAFELVLARYAIQFFKHEQAAGTPFTLQVSNELFRLGILTIVLSLTGLILATITGAIMRHFLPGVEKLALEDYSSVGLGLLFLAISQLCKLGAEKTGSQ